MSSDWTPIALSRDVPDGVTRAVCLEGSELVIWRGAGEAHVWEDRCPHRGMRLSLGFVRDGALNCLYHGWQYGASSSCVRIPAHPDLIVPPTIKANAYPTREAGGLIWVGKQGAGALPALPATRTPVLSLAVATDGVEAQGLMRDLDGGRLHVFWHRVEPGKVMLHGVIEGSADVSRAAALMRQMRTQYEEGVAA
ncbi:Rieske 2Fe-2S domain-containing protein [Devosia sp.]|jgi:phenylpropionate dioxygenase-like ring-hydroxylating dioxygenase large terminal subunit|uniref:Rieske 2Fe-2S domain-containing protein n=1 Tax=Devosia sp. TaxID=1871048 RepID=UPI0037C02366